MEQEQNPTITDIENQPAANVQSVGDPLTAPTIQIPESEQQPDEADRSSIPFASDEYAPVPAYCSQQADGGVTVGSQPSPQYIPVLTADGQPMPQYAPTHTADGQPMAQYAPTHTADGQPMAQYVPVYTAAGDYPQKGAAQQYVPIAAAPAPREKSEKRKKFDEMVSNTSIGLLAAFVLVFCMLYSHLIVRSWSFGIGVTIITVLFYALFTGFMLRKGKNLNAAGLLLIVPVAAAALSFAFNASGGGIYIMVLSLVALFALQTAAMSGCLSGDALSGKGCFQSLRLHAIGWGGFMPASCAAVFGNKKKDDTAKSGGSRVGVRIVIGLAISIPIVAILIAIFSAADAAFRYYVVQVLDYINTKISLGEVLLDTFIGFNLCFYFLPLVLGLRLGRVEQPAKEKEHKRFLDPVISSTVTIASAVVYLLFVLVQFTYFFPNQIGSMFDYKTDPAQALPGNVNWAEYARSGFAELNVVIIGTYIVILLMLAFTRLSASGKVSVVLRSALTLLAACNLVLAASAVMRMVLYIAYCGLTAKRIEALLIIAFVTISLLFVIVRIWIPKLPIFKVTAIIAICFLVGFCWMNPDRLCAKVNVDRHLDSKLSIDIDYLGQLSCAAAGDVERLYLETEDRNIKAAAKGILASYIFGDYYEFETISDLDPGSWTFDAQRALRICEKYSLDEFDVNDYEIYANYQRAEREHKRWSDDEYHYTFEEFKERY